MYIPAGGGWKCCPRPWSVAHGAEEKLVQGLTVVYRCSIIHVY